MFHHLSSHSCAGLPDRAKAPKSVLVDVPDGPKGVKLSAATSELTQPLLIHQETLAEGTALHMGFATRAAGTNWITKLESQGALASAPQKGTRTKYLLPMMPIALRLDRSTLAALAYIAQTHFAEQFPEAVRSAAFRPFIDFTWAAAQLERARERARGAVVKAGGDPLDTQQVDATPEVLAAQTALDASLTAFGGDWPIGWWWPAGNADGSCADDPHGAPNAYDFGHRVTVGIEAGASAAERADGAEEGGGVAYA
ncbi:hypothetical protein AB870_24225 (plasmid) [Pandoraea faecigallinarum]|uniref:Uncharacterized protein n=1 Tax=Pandoraea faecigallinarum TaxID=656179 RepID=A0A0H3WZZ9_9BURK|nr:hypothetical protein [Pandoraea faecigallinarum]AKM33307.1 hypothetical protein AB870_24225 [Pandoraea faecigallinarum]